MYIVIACFFVNYSAYKLFIKSVNAVCYYSVNYSACLYCLNFIFCLQYSLLFMHCYYCFKNCMLYYFPAQYFPVYKNCMLYYFSAQYFLCIKTACYNIFLHSIFLLYKNLHVINLYCFDSAYIVLFSAQYIIFYTVLFPVYKNTTQFYFLCIKILQVFFWTILFYVYTKFCQYYFLHNTALLFTAILNIIN